MGITLITVSILKMHRASILYHEYKSKTDFHTYIPAQVIEKNVGMISL